MTHDETTPVNLDLFSSRNGSTFTLKCSVRANAFFECLHVINQIQHDYADQAKYSLE